METLGNNHNEFSQNSLEKEGIFQEVVMLLKPGAAQFEEGIYDFCDKNGLIVTGRNKLKFDDDKVKEFYPKSANADYFNPLKEYFAKDEIIALMIEGANAMSLLNNLKKRFRGIMNLKMPEDRLHVSDSPEEVTRERKVVGFNDNINS